MHREVSLNSYTLHSKWAAAPLLGRKNERTGGIKGQSGEREREGRFSLEVMSDFLRPPGSLPGFSVHEDSSGRAWSGLPFPYPKESWNRANCKRA